MPHMLAAERMGYLDANALANSPSRNQATITAALAALGSSVAWLVLPFSGDGVWTVTSNTSIPRLYVPLGVTVDVAVGVALGVGLVDAANSGWKTGPGTLNITAASTPMQLSHIACTSYFQSNSGTGPVWTLNAGAGNPAAIRMFTDQGGLSTGIEISRNIANTDSTWELLATTPGDFAIVRPGGTPKILVNNNGVMIGANVAPLHALQMGVDDAFKATASWSTVSDEQLKNILGNYTDGLATVLAFPQAVRFTFNGKAGTPNDGKEQIGMTAQGVQPVAPYMISSYQDKLEPDDPTPTTILSMNNSAMVYMFVNAFKDVNARLVALEAPALRTASIPEASEEMDEDEKPVDADAPKRPRRRAS